jgi:hypothetical protein
LTPGHTYRWWIRATLDNGNSTAWSTAKDFTIMPLSAPTLKTPSVISTTSTSASVNFSWSTVNMAVRYEIWIDDLTTGRSKVVHNSNLVTTSFTTVLSRNHRYRWWMRAFSANGTACPWSIPLDLRVS